MALLWLWVGLFACGAQASMPHGSNAYVDDVMMTSDHAHHGMVEMADQPDASCCDISPPDCCAPTPAPLALSMDYDNVALLNSHSVTVVSPLLRRTKEPIPIKLASLSDGYPRLHLVHCSLLD